MILENLTRKVFISDLFRASEVWLLVDVISTVLQLTNFFYFSPFTGIWFWHILSLIVLLAVAVTENGRAFNVSWLFGGHPVLDPVTLMSEANRYIGILLDLLRSASSLRGSLTIAVVNWYVQTYQFLHLFIIQFAHLSY